MPKKPGYEEYIRSPQWYQRRLAFRAIHGNGSCKICRTRSKLHIHHLRYDNFGNEPDEDLMTLCEPHHALVHNEQRRTKKLLATVTMKVVEREKGKPAPDLKLTAPPKTRSKKPKRNKRPAQPKKVKQRKAPGLTVKVTGKPGRLDAAILNLDEQRRRGALAALPPGKRGTKRSRKKRRGLVTTRVAPVEVPDPKETVARNIARLRDH